MIKVLVFDQQSDLKIDPESAKKVAAVVIELERCQANELSLYFVNTKEICRLHEEFFDDPSVTDCISFPLDKDKKLGYQLLGEVFVCPQTALDYVRHYEDLNQDPYLETTLYVTHSILHLLGYDDIAPEDEKVMRAKEQSIMRYLIEHKILLRK